jgi:RNA polymerase sigma-70 factor (ECF subfamily)
MQTVTSRRPDYAQYQDEEMVARVRRGEREAFRGIVQRYNRRLYRVARGVMRDDGEAEDVVQEAYLRAYAALGEFRGESSLATWLTQIVLNEARGRLRRRRPTEDLEVLDMTAQQSSVVAFPGVTAFGDPETAAAQAQIRRLLERAVDQLPDPFRLVFIMRDIDGLSIEETGAQLGIRPETVKTRLHRARRLLREHLNDKLSSALKDTLPFDGARCNRMTDAVMRRLHQAHACGS